MEPTTARNEEKKGSRLSQAATSLGGGSKASLSRSEEFLTRISAELTNEALLVAGYPVNNVPTKEKQTQDQGTQLSKHALTETVPAARHTSCHPLVTRELCPAA
ncbi:hypothetical protein mRhiFer1_016750 [Rhinolophus ferrumequinum]|uniref:Uncharacterized protein n=1 Tax=Rhinolophus ferrumequinum TaxID=59479 RepID=A0A7J7R6N1_RHIFE|nr:hypothetical protein mRhiFer1_016750 [Rhinolophus ferrumequinum]